MGFKKVYKALQEIFPEVDARALRAVAIEHQKDPDAAVDVVLTEVIPFLTERARPSTPSSEDRNAVQSPKAELTNGTYSKQDAHLGNEPSSSSSEIRVAVQSSKAEIGGNGTYSEQEAYLVNGFSSSPSESRSALKSPRDEELPGQFYDAECEHDQVFDDANGGLNQINGDNTTASGVLLHENGEISDHHKICEDTESEETITSENFQGKNIELGSNENSFTSSSVGCENWFVNQSMSAPLVESTCGETGQEHLCSDGNMLAVENFVGHMSPSNTLTLSYSKSNIQSVTMPDILNTDLEKELNAVCKVESVNELVDVEGDSTWNTGITRSAQICSIDLVEDFIADARNYKKTLYSEMESLINLMREVELQEKTAEKVKKEAAEGGLEILKTVEDRKQMLQRAKEANDMHAGEVHGEKAILATEVRELQSRLLSLSDERDKSLGLLNEMRQSVEVRLAAAEKEIEAAEKEKLEKEDVARKSLAEQELIMEKVVQEANILKQEAEENAKLQEFLVDRGRVVDMLQGEISLICKDVKSLKEKFDERLPLSKSLTSTQTSCILASSSSSLKSLVPEEVDQTTNQAHLSETAEKTDWLPSFDGPQFSEAETSMDDNKTLVDEGWEICDNCDANTREAYM